MAEYEPVPEEEIIAELYKQLEEVEASEEDLGNLTVNEAFTAGFKFCLTYLNHLKEYGRIIND